MVGNGRGRKERAGERGLRRRGKRQACPSFYKFQEEPCAVGKENYKAQGRMGTSYRISRSHESGHGGSIYGTTLARKSQAERHEGVFGIRIRKLAFSVNAMARGQKRRTVDRTWRSSIKSKTMGQDHKSTDGNACYRRNGWGSNLFPREKVETYMGLGHPLGPWMSYLLMVTQTAARPWRDTR